MIKPIRAMTFSIAIVTSALALSGCQPSSGSSNAAGAQPSSSSDVPGSAPSASNGGTGGQTGDSSTDSGGSTGQSSTPQCRSNDVKPTDVKNINENGGQTVQVTVTNTSGRSCQIHGWPGVAWQGTQVADGGKIHPLQVTHNGRAENDILRPNATAYTWLTHTAGDDSNDDPNCASQVGIGISMPGDSTLRWANFSGNPFCNGQVVATPMTTH
jgi:hypothetical protein